MQLLEVFHVIHCRFMQHQHLCLADEVPAASNDTEAVQISNATPSLRRAQTDPQS